MCNDLVSGLFFQYSYLYTIVITMFFGGKLGIFGGSFYPSNTLDRTLTGTGKITEEIVGDKVFSQ